MLRHLVRQNNAKITAQNKSVYIVRLSASMSSPWADLSVEEYLEILLKEAGFSDEEAERMKQMIVSRCRSRRNKV